MGFQNQNEQENCLQIGFFRAFKFRAHAAPAGGRLRRQKGGACGAGGGAPAAPEEGRLRRQRSGAKVAYGAQGELEKGACPPPPDHYKPLAVEGGA